MSFAPTSRYYETETAKHETPDGKLIVHLCRRFVPPPGNFQTIAEHTVKQGERLDQIAAEYLDDPEQFWRICDANGALDPAELAETGRKIRITLPEGIPGPAVF